MQDRKVVDFWTGIRMNSRRLLETTQKLYSRFMQDEIGPLGAQLTYYLILSFFPFLIVVLTLISYIQITDEEAMRLLSKLLPYSAYEIIVAMISQAVNGRSETLLSFSMAAGIWAASNGMLALTRGLNKAYGDKETRPFWKTRGIAVLFTLGLALSILLSMVLLVFGRAFGEYIFSLIGFSRLFEPVWDIIRLFLTLSIMMLVFIFMYRYIPSRRLCFREVFPGSLLSTAGWIIISLAFSFYVNNFSNYSNMYGSIGGIFVLLIWLYLSSVIILTGGELNAILTTTHT